MRDAAGVVEMLAIRFRSLFSQGGVPHRCFFAASSLFLLEVQRCFAFQLVLSTAGRASSFDDFGKTRRAARRRVFR